MRGVVSARGVRGASGSVVGGAILLLEFGGGQGSDRCASIRTLLAKLN